MVDGLTPSILAVLQWVLGALGALAIGGGAVCAGILRASEADRPRDPRSDDAPRDLVETVIEKVLGWFQEGWRLQPVRLRVAPPGRSRPPRDH